ncbi:2OG-Fe(II) oxygenase [Microbulbifer sp. 2304DJ12-6]|uniref:2OG-Fe(II) oxygenase n=1 Tax=Microbulbifer sp. 2304DJ12-6 TaxID=3233340 RepID=UPI00263090EC|nr:2OG-Fe(II) oxygenase [uncultured Microbulbifer sp.]
MSQLAIDRLNAAEVKAAPFPHFYLAQSLPPDEASALIRSFPALHKGGSFNIEDVKISARLRRFVEQFDSAEVRRILGEKFELDLTDKPMMATLRGYSRAKDGRIHTDSKSKLITVLVYLNETWPSPTGRLRILRNGDDMEDYADELLPGPGALVAFKVTDNCWHGYRSFTGKRQSIQINFLTGDRAKSKHQFFHGISARIKSLFQ